MRRTDAFIGIRDIAASAVDPNFVVGVVCVRAGGDAIAGRIRRDDCMKRRVLARDAVLDEEIRWHDDFRAHFQNDAALAAGRFGPDGISTILDLRKVRRQSKSSAIFDVESSEQLASYAVILAQHQRCPAIHGHTAADPEKAVCIERAQIFFQLNMTRWNSNDRTVINLK